MQPARELGIWGSPSPVESDDADGDLDQAPSATDERLAQVVEELFDLRPQGLIERFDLLNGDIYRRIPKTLFMDDYPWEKTDMAEKLLKALA